MTTLLSKAPKHRARFHTLTVTDVERLTDDAVALTFSIPDDLIEEYAFQPGQHLTLRAKINGEDVRRSYSISRSAGYVSSNKKMRVATARVANGVMSNWINDTVAAGDQLEVMTPAGSFICPTDTTRAKHHLAIVGGSGITPVMSLLATALEDEPQSQATLLYGNRRTSTIMFLEELADLKNEYPTRFHLINVLEDEAPDVELFNGRLDKERLTTILDDIVGIESVDEWYMCGPLPMVEGAQALLNERGVDPHIIHHELFHVDNQPPTGVVEKVVVDDAAPPAAVVTVNLDGRTTIVKMPTKAETILAATLRARPDAPFSCAGGVCGTCRARVIEGEVAMDRNWALEPDEVAAGVILACQAHPVTDTVVLDYD
ncbi:MAG TPA: 1,2-phenylacetyl-CoA epoxidase subunit PaaE [Dermatophilaceae bacterium]|nr:1,2-phenylacetyl-CoA epoxidase subunit PaaE [Dermatophilaceae bacterium]